MQSSNSEKLITIVGGSGFIGRHVVRNLAKRGYRIRVACRRPDLAGHVVPFGVPGQIVPVQANVRYPASLAAACDGAYAVINLVGVLLDGNPQGFDGIHVFGAEAVAKAARAAKTRIFVHMSALGANADSRSDYARSKAAGEAAAKAAYPTLSILRPSIVFGPEDNFFNKFAFMARFSPVIPVIGAETRFQPVFVGDVAEAIAVLVDRGMGDGRALELGGPEVRTFAELIRYVLKVTVRRRILLPIPFPAATMLSALTGLLPNAPLTSDQVELLKHDNVVSAAAEAESRTLQGLGIAPRALEAVAPDYLYRYRKAGQFTAAQA